MRQPCPVPQPPAVRPGLLALESARVSCVPQRGHPVLRRQRAPVHDRQQLGRHRPRDGQERGPRRRHASAGGALRLPVRGARGRRRQPVRPGGAPLPLHRAQLLPGAHVQRPRRPQHPAPSLVRSVQSPAAPASGRRASDPLDRRAACAARAPAPRPGGLRPPRAQGGRRGLCQPPHEPILRAAQQEPDRPPTPRARDHRPGPCVRWARAGGRARQVAFRRPAAVHEP
jgi:hypothetical protein